MTPEYGAATQLEKIDMLDFADIIAINKFDKRGAQDALRDVKSNINATTSSSIRTWKKCRFQHHRFPVQRPGTNTLYRVLMDTMTERTGAALQSSFKGSDEMSEKIYIIPQAGALPRRNSDNNRNYDSWGGTAGLPSPANCCSG